jgi:ArsR family transcriptional regulator
MTNTLQTAGVAASTMQFVDDDQATERTVALLKALAHPIRFQIMQLLADKRRFGLDDVACCATDEVCVCRIKKMVDISAPTLSHHLKLLREAGLIEGRRDGVWIYYSIVPGALAEVTQTLGELLALVRVAGEQPAS